MATVCLFRLFSMSKDKSYQKKHDFNNEQAKNVKRSDWIALTREARKKTVVIKTITYCIERDTVQIETERNHTQEEGKEENKSWRICFVELSFLLLTKHPIAPGAGQL